MFPLDKFTSVMSYDLFWSLRNLGITQFFWLVKVLNADSRNVEDAIRCGGLAPTKASCIKNVLSCLLERRGKLCLEYLQDLSVDEIKSELSLFKGIGPKTVIFSTNLFYNILGFCLPLQVQKINKNKNTS